MRKIFVEKEETKSIPSPLEVIHLCAEANGSTARMRVEDTDHGIYIFHIDEPSQNITKGYLAVLYLIEDLGRAGVAHAFFDHNHPGTFTIAVRNRTELTNYLLG